MDPSQTTTGEDVVLEGWFSRDKSACAEGVEEVKQKRHESDEVNCLNELIRLPLPVNLRLSKG